MRYAQDGYKYWRSPGEAPKFYNETETSVMLRVRAGTTFRVDKIRQRVEIKDDCVEIHPRTRS